MVWRSNYWHYIDANGQWHLTNCCLKMMNCNKNTDKQYLLYMNIIWQVKGSVEMCACIFWQVTYCGKMCICIFSVKSHVKGKARAYLWLVHDVVIGLSCDVGNGDAVVASIGALLDLFSVGVAAASASSLLALPLGPAGGSTSILLSMKGIWNATHQHNSNAH